MKFMEIFYWVSTFPFTPVLDINNDQSLNAYDEDDLDPFSCWTQRRGKNFSLLRINEGNYDIKSCTSLVLYPVSTLDVSLKEDT